MAEAETKSVADVLREARKLIEKPENWTQGRYAKDRFGEVVSPKDRAAECFCLIGAVRRVSPDFDTEDAAYDLLLKGVGESPVAFNDRRGRTHAEVLAAFDAAITRAEAQ